MAGDTKEKIIEQAVELFYSHGFVKASVRDLAGGLGITQASIYNHFKNKDEILFTIMDRLGEDLAAMLTEISDAGDDPVQGLWRMVYRHLCLFKEKKKEFRIFVDELNRLPEKLEASCSTRHRQIFELYRNKIMQIAGQGKANPIDPTAAAFSILGVIIWFYRWVNEDGPLDVEQAAGEILKLLFFGLLNPGAQTAAGLSRTGNPVGAPFSRRGSGGCVEWSFQRGIPDPVRRSR